MFFEINNINNVFKGGIMIYYFPKTGAQMPSREHRLEYVNTGAAAVGQLYGAFSQQTSAMRLCNLFQYIF